jgi:hypothetical protein
MQDATRFLIKHLFRYLYSPDVFVVSVSKLTGCVEGLSLQEFFAHIFIVLLSLVALEIRDISLGWEEIRARNVTDSFWNVFFGYISRDGKAFGSILMAGKHSLIVFCSWCWKGVMERSIVLIS